MNRIVEFFRENRVLFQFYLILSILVVIFFSLLHFEISRRYIAEVYPRWLALEVTTIMNWLGIQASVMGSTVVLKNFSYTIIYHCSAVFAMMIYAAAVFAYPANWGQKFLGVLIGFPLLSLVNTTRLIVLGLIGVYFPNLFDYFHEYLWQGIFIIFVILLWMGWRIILVKDDPLITAG